jgi:hypothetical protein
MWAVLDVYRVEVSNHGARQAVHESQMIPTNELLVLPPSHIICR